MRVTAVSVGRSVDLELHGNSMQMPILRAN